MFQRKVKNTVTFVAIVMVFVLALTMAVVFSTPSDQAANAMTIFTKTVTGKTITLDEIKLKSHFLPEKVE